MKRRRTEREEFINRKRLRGTERERERERERKRKRDDCKIKV